MVTFNLEKIEHSYLILMIMFESMFKRVEERNAENASIRISKFLAQDEAEMISINDEFYKEKKQDSFCKIRNAIAHGDPSFDIEIIKAKYPILYSYVTKAIITLLHMPDTDFDKSKDYYDELDKYLNNK
ncbi:MAG: hypothetical protein KAS32_24340 [Candidatus Peribacteraceae bacterium]|nr:hypothetical protein [Candidatus Peribacteraceae bacterium]